MHRQATASGRLEEPPACRLDQGLRAAHHTHPLVQVAQDAEHLPLRIALMRGAHALEHAWLAAEASGLCGSIFAGFIPSALRDFVDVDGLTRMTCLAFAFGSRPT